MGWRSNRSVAAPVVEMRPTDTLGELRTYGVTAEFLAHLRKHNHTPEQVLLFFTSGGHLADLQAMTHYANPTAPRQPNPVPPIPQPKPAEMREVDPAAPAVPSEYHRPRRSTTTRRPRSKTWRDELIAHGGLTAIFALVVIANGLGTIFGVISLAPSGLVWLIVGGVFGLGLHVVISRIEIAYLQWRYLRSWFVLPLTLALLLDIGTSVQGFLWLSSMLFPGLFKDDMPSDIWLWGPLFQSGFAQINGWAWELAGEVVDWSVGQPPIWGAKAWVILLVISLIAIASERLLRGSYQSFREMLEERHMV